MAEQYSVNAVLSAVDSSFSSTFRNASKTITAFQSGTQTGLGRVGQTISGIGGKLTKGVTLPLGLMAAAAAKTSMDFNSQMSRVQAISGATGKQMGAMKAQAIDLGAKTAFSAKQAAEGMENLASAGMNSTQIMKAMPGVLNLAAVSGGDVAKSAENMATALNSFGLSASKSGHVADVFAKAAAKTNAEASDMGEALKYVAPQAHAAGLSLEETSAAIGILSNNGIKGSAAGTTLAQALMRVQKPSAQAKKAMDQLGFSAYDTATGKMKPLAKQVSELKGKMKGMTDEQKANALATIYGMEGGRAMNILLGEQDGKLASLTKSLKNSKGSAADMAKIMQDNAKSAVEQLGGAFESAAIVIGDKMAPTIKNVANWISDMVGKFNDASPSVQNFILTLLGIAAAIGPLMVVTGKVMTFVAQVSAAKKVLKDLNGAFKLSSAVMKAVPWIVFIAGIALLIKGFKDLYDSSETFRNIMKTIGSLLMITAPLFTWLGGLIGDFVGWLVKATGGLSDTNKAFLELGGGLVLIGASVLIAKKGLGPLGTILGGVGKGFAGITKSIGGLAGKLFGIGSSGATAAGGATKAGSSASGAAKSFAGMGLAILEAGIGIGVALAGVAALVYAIAALAKTGSSGVIAMVTFGATVVVLAGTFALLGPVLTASAAGLVAFGVAVLAAGAGAALFGVGALAMGTGIDIAAHGAMILVQAFILLASNISLVVPMMSTLGTGFAVMLLSFVTAATTVIPQVVLLITNMIIQLLATIAAALPQMMASGVQIIVEFIQGLTSGLPQILTAGVQFIITLLNGIAQNIGSIITAAVNVIVAFLGGLTDNMARIITAGVAFVVSIIQGIADNLGEIINAAVNLIGQFLVGLARAIPQIADKAYDAVMEFVEGVGYVIGRALSSGGDLINHFITGIAKGINGSRNAGKDNGNAVLNAVKNIDLFNAGSKIINGFLKGLRSAYGAVKSFVSGIAGWIKSHKGPITYDRKLLIPAGQAIMTGLNDGLIDNFKMVKNNVSGMASSIADAATVTLPSVDGSAFNATLTSLSNQIKTTSLNSDVNVNSSRNVVIQTQLDINGREFARATSDDMSQVLNQKEARSNRLNGIR